MVEEEIKCQGGKKTNEDSSAHAQLTVVKREDKEASENQRQVGEDEDGGSELEPRQ